MQEHFLSYVRPNGESAVAGLLQALGCMVMGLSLTVGSALMFPSMFPNTGVRPSTTMVMRYVPTSDFL